MSKDMDDIPLPQSPKESTSIPQNYSTNFPHMNYFMTPSPPPPPPSIPFNYPYRFPTPIPPRLHVPTNFHHENIRQKNYFNFNEFVSKREELYEKFKELVKMEDELDNGTYSENKNIDDKRKKSKKNKINITFYRESINKLEKILSEINSEFDLLKNDVNNEDIKNKIENLREEYTNLSLVVNNEKNLKLLKREVNRRKSKRKRQYKKRLQSKLNEIINEKAIEQKHEEIDKNLKIINDKIRMDEEKKEAKKIVDETLHQVNKKLLDVKMTIDFCNSLRKLRLIRRQHARDKNLYPKLNDPNEEIFDKSLKELETVVLNQKVIYENEKTNLKLKIDFEKEKRIKKEKEIKKEKFESELNFYEKKLKEVLFGNNDETLNENDPLYLLKQFYKQSENSIESLLFIRQQWDQYIVAKGTIGATGIPLEWVYPSEPSDSNWAQYIKKE